MENKLKNTLKSGLLALKQKASPEQILLWIAYVELLAKWNKVYNLSGISDPNSMMIRHILDSLCIGDFLEDPSIQLIADVGNGPGLPGIPLAILFPQKKFILVESRQKRLIFLKQAILALGLSNVELGQGRVEELPVPILKPDRILSRAFAKLADMLNITQSWAGPHTVWLAMKGEIVQEELSNIPSVYAKPIVRCLTPPFEKAPRHLVMIRQA